LSWRAVVCCCTVSALTAATTSAAAFATSFAIARSAGLSPMTLLTTAPSSALPECFTAFCSAYFSIEERSCSEMLMGRPCLPVPLDCEPGDLFDPLLSVGPVQPPHPLQSGQRLGDQLGGPCDRVAD